MKRRVIVLIGLVALLASVGAFNAQATVTAVSIDDAPTVVTRGETFDVTFTWNHAAGHCNTYGSTVTLGSLATPLDQAQENYAAATLDCPGPNTRTAQLTVPSDAPFGVQPLTVNVAEFTAGNGFDQTDTTSVYIAGGNCPDGWEFQGSTGANDPYDTNGDGLICTKDVSGAGNSANSQRKGGAAADSGHIDGHNHKDNNN